MSERNNTLEEKLSDFCRQYAAQLPDKLDRLEKLWVYFRSSGGDYEALRKFHQLLHQMAGSAGTYGFSAVGDVVRELEIHLAGILEKHELPGEALCRKVSDGLSNARAAAAHLRQGQPERRNKVDEPRSSDQMPVVCVLSDDLEDADELAVQIGYYGYHTEVYHPGKLDEALLAGRPDVLIVALSAAFSERMIADTLGRITAKLIPVVCLLASGEIQGQLAAIRAGVSVCLTRPFELSGLIERLDLLTARKSQDPYRILVVGPDEASGRIYEACLSASQMEVKILKDPFQVLRAVADFVPDLILMDLDLPGGCNGFELAAVVRQQESCLAVPIVFLASETGDGRKLLALQLGGDDCLAKPVQESDLVAIVAGRIQRSRLLVHRMVRDGLTGLYNHCHVKEQLEIEIARAVRGQADMTFCLIDIVGLQAINERYGHATGDNVLKSLAGLLRQRLRKTDTLGRFAGGIFAAVLEGTGLANAKKVFEELSASFAKLRHAGGVDEFSAQFCCGIASVSDCKNPVQMLAACHQALLKAKASRPGSVMV
jgi:diguanylate cyclase (GGDEF)-like protein